MLVIVEKFSELRFSELMQVYEESNMINSEIHSDLSNSERIRDAEQEFYQYLSAVFFRQKDSCYVIWEENGRYISALRLEPYEDGYLVCALETAPEFRRQGYAQMLLSALMLYLKQSSDGRVYSHISKKNTASLLLHKKCGFQILHDYAVHLDGSVFHDSVTMRCEYKKTES